MMQSRSRWEAVRAALCIEFPIQRQSMNSWTGWRISNPEAVFRRPSKTFDVLKDTHLLHGTPDLRCCRLADPCAPLLIVPATQNCRPRVQFRSEEHTSELQSHS